MKDFFVNSSAYELPHLLVIAYFLFSTTLLILLTKLFAKSEKAKTYVIKISAGVLLFLVILSRFIYNDFTPNIKDFLPNTFCSTIGFIFPLFLLFSKKDSKSLFFSVYAALMGGLITVFSGDDIGQERVANTIISYLYHGFMASV